MAQVPPSALRRVLRWPRSSAFQVLLQSRGFSVMSEKEFSRQVGLNNADKAAQLSGSGSSIQSSNMGYSRKASESWERIFGKKAKADKLASEKQQTSTAVTILDGGIGHQLKATGVEISGPVGTMRRFLGVAVANMEQPELVKNAHLAYIDAGAEIITTNSYSCVPKCLEHACDSTVNLRDDGISGIIAQAGKLARASCELRPKSKTKVAGCLPPLAESYRPDKVGPYEENLEHYKTIVNSIAPYSDLFVCETMSTVDEARAAVTAAAGAGLPIWVSWTLNEKEPVLRSGESIKEAVEAVKNVEGARVEACLFNCTSPEVITLAMPILRDIVPSNMRIGAYANGFCTAESGSGEYRDLTPEQYYEDFAAKWVASGATIVGGCCGVFPRHIAHLSKALREPCLSDTLPV